MLNRQRALLRLLVEAGGTASHLDVTKWAFLLRQETPSRGGSAYFQFVPYKFGPFSFCLFQEAEALRRDGYLESVDVRTWGVLPAGQSSSENLAPRVRTDVADVVRRFKRLSRRRLIEYVYNRYKWYTINSEIDRRAARPVASPATYTAGYEGLLVDGFLNGLLQRGIRRVIDVRNNPVSRRYGFHKTTFARLCGSLEIEYRHFPQLGIESADRVCLDGPAAYSALFEHYEATTLRSHSLAIANVASLMSKMPSVLVCMEARPDKCHRSRLAKAVSEVANLPVHHLELAA